MSVPFRPALLLAASLLAGCASLSRERGYAETRALVEARQGSSPDWTAEGAAPAIPSDPIDVADAIRLAFQHNPRIREEYARLGLARADVDAAQRLSNPGFDVSRLKHEDGGTQLTRGITLGFTELLLLPARKRLAAGELERTQLEVAAALLDLANEVETAWYAAVGAQQVAAMRELVAQAGQQSSELAQRFFDAGNINRLQLAVEQAAAASARIDAVRAMAESARARSALAALLGLPSGAEWSTQSQLPAPTAVTVSADAMVALALEQRLDLAGARKRVALLEDALGVTRRWRWVGDIEVGYERERETDGSRLQGPTLSLQLPIFNQGQAAVARAEAELAQARATLDALALATHNDARLSLDRLGTARDIAERYRTLLLPQREAIVARTQERVNFMFSGVFELIQARQQEFDAYQEYLEAVRDYWSARAELRHAVGGRLPDDDVHAEPTIGVDAILPSTPPMDHSAHGMPDADDPHRHHRMPAADPHAGHGDPTQVPADTAPDEHERMDHSGHGTPSEAEDDAHRDHRMPAPDPHAGHDPASAPEADASDEQHDHGDTP